MLLYRTCLWLVACGITAALAISSYGQQHAAGSARIAFKETLHDFGRIPEGPLFEHAFEFTNTGTEPIIILGCQTSDPHYADWTKEPVLPGKKGKSTVVMPTQGRRGPFGSKFIWVRTNALHTNAPSGYDSTVSELAIKG